MELTHLQTFVAVAEEKSISGAARRLFTTPSAVSMQVKALETELHVQLFVRSSRGVELTDIGRQLKAKAQQTLQSARELTTYASETQLRLAGRVGLGLNATPRFLRAAALVRDLASTYPDVELHLTNASSGKIIEEVRQGRLDLGFVFGDRPLPDLDVQPLHMAHLVIAAPCSWHEQVQGAGWIGLAQLPWIYADGYCPFQMLVDDLFGAHGLTYQRLVLSNDESTKADLVAAGLGLALLEEGEAQARSDIMTANVPPIECPLSLVSLTRRRHEGMIKAMTQCIRAVWNQV
jgi:DNA-binding transcriptional LysR family regulator